MVRLWEPRTPLRSILFDLGVVVALLLATVIGALSYPVSDWVLAVGMIGALPPRRRYPLTVFGMVSSLALIQVLATHLLVPPLRAQYITAYDLAVLVAMYGAVKYGRRILDGILAAVVVAIGAVIASLHISNGWKATMVMMGTVCAGIWLAGLTTRTRRLYVASLEDRAATAERERDHLAAITVAAERAAIARELHDIVAHSMAVMIVQADGARYALDRDPEKARAALATVGDTGRTALEEMRRLVTVLRKADQAAGTAPTVRKLPSLDELVERFREAGLHVETDVQGRSDGLPAGMALALYRIAQEALTNALKHAGTGAKAHLAVAYTPERVTFSAVDDGGGRATSGVALPGGHGLVGMRERVAVYGGDFHAGPRLAGGWEVRATIPHAPLHAAAEVPAAIPHAVAEVPAAPHATLAEVPAGVPHAAPHATVAEVPAGVPHAAPHATVAEEDT